VQLACTLNACLPNACLPNACLPLGGEFAVESRLQSRWIAIGDLPVGKPHPFREQPGYAILLRWSFAESGYAGLLALRLDGWAAGGKMGRKTGSSFVVSRPESKPQGPGPPG